MIKEDFLRNDCEEMEVSVKLEKHFCSIHGIEWFETPLRNNVCPFCLEDRAKAKVMEK